MLCFIGFYFVAFDVDTPQYFDLFYHFTPHFFSLTHIYKVSIFFFIEFCNSKLEK
jgi:hypothetical protein